jgi:hypothetical protein
VAHKQAVDCEVATGYVLPRVGGENDLIRVPAIGIADLTAKGSHFDFSRSAENLHNSELRANREALREQLQDPFREGVRGDVVIGGLAANENIPHTAPDKERFMAMAL